MAARKYRFNPDTLAYEKVQERMRLRLYPILRKVVTFFIVVCIMNIFFSFVFHTPKLARITHENEELLIRYNILNKRIKAASRTIDDLHTRDNSVYRPLFGVDSLDITGIYIPYSDSVYSYMSEYDYGDVMISSWRSLDNLTRRLYRESRSLDELQAYAMDKENMATSIPAIWPIDRRSLRSTIGAYGGRRHPIYGRYIKHEGIDLPAKPGTPVYATGNGIVRMIDNGFRSHGYGRQILVDHGFGYKTRYAHLSAVEVEPGQTVTRGEQIGRVGSTGASTGPHLHYEVIHMGNTINPINYFRRDMDPTEFEQIIKSARETTYELLE